MDLIGELGGFVKGAGEGAWEAGKGAVQGVGSLAVGAYTVATDKDYRAHAWQQAMQHAQSVERFAETVVTDPATAAGEVGQAAGATWDRMHTAYDEAAAGGHGSEFVGRMFGAGAVIAGVALIPGGAEVDGLAAAGETVEAESLLTGGLARGTAAETDVAEAGASQIDPLRGRTQSEFSDLASDPAHGGKIDPKSEQERRVGLDIEARGDVPGPITRDPSGAAEFVDDGGQKWDVKGFNSNFPPRKGGFDLARDAGKVEKSLAQNEHVMLDTSKMSPADIAALKAEGVARGWGARVQWWP